MRDSQLKSYRKSVEKNAASLSDNKQMLTNGSMGLCGEAGEVCDLVKKYLFHGAPLDRDKVLKELGDVRWYMELLCIALSTTLEEVEDLNMAKLALRYKNGFTKEEAQTKVDNNSPLSVAAQVQMIEELMGGQEICDEAGNFTGHYTEPLITPEEGRHLLWDLMMIVYIRRVSYEWWKKRCHW